jgi:hypothetical protein
MRSFTVSNGCPIQSFMKPLTVPAANPLTRLYEAKRIGVGQVVWDKHTAVSEGLASVIYKS